MKWLILPILLFSSVALAQPFEDPIEPYINSAGQAAGNISLDGGYKLYLEGTDTYIYSSAGNTIGMLTNNSLRLQIDASNVTISNAGLVIGTAAKAISNSAEVLSLGSVCTSTHSLVTGDACFGAGAAVEFDDQVWFDSGVASGDSVIHKFGTGLDAGMYWSAFHTNHSLTFYTDVNNGSYSGNFIFTTKGNVIKNHRQGLSANPRLSVFSATDPSSGDTEWVSVSQNTTDGLFEIGEGDYRFNSSNGKDTASYIRTKTESVTFAAHPGDASKVTVGSIIPAGAFVIGVSGRVTTANTGGCTSIDIGIVGKDTDAFADGIAVAATTTFTTASGNAAADYSATSLGIIPSIAAQEITVTAVGGDGACDNMVVAITVHYMSVSAATSN